MISLKELYPEGSYIDFKDKDTNDWQVGFVLKTNQNSVRVRTEGWPSKYDELIFDFNNRIKPFRTIVRGYTGQQKNPAVREHWKFTLEDHKQRLQMIRLFNSQQNSDNLKWIQFLRGEHYFYIDFLLSQTYKNEEELQNMYNYFKQHIVLANRYLQELRTSYQQWFAQNHKQKGYREAYYQMFDGVYLLTANSMRHSNFKKNNSALINTVYPNATHQYLIAKMIKDEGLDMKVVKIVNLLISEKNTKLPVPFVYAIFRLFLAIEKSLVQRDEGGKQQQAANKMKRKKFILSLFQVIKREVNELKPSDVKSPQNQKQLQSLLSQIVPLFFKYGIQKPIFQWVAKSRLKCDILLLGTDSLQRKLKGTNKLKEHLQSAIIKNEYALCKLTIDSYVEVFKQANVSEVIFIQNQHPQIIKKGVDLWMSLYKQKAVNFQDLLKIWKNCIGKHEAIRKIIFQFWIDLIPIAQKQIEQLIEAFLSKMNHPEQINQEWQVTMFCNFIIKILELQYSDTPTEPLKPQTFTLIILAGYNKLSTMKDGQQFQKLVMQYAKAITRGEYANNLIKECYLNLGRGNNFKFNTLFLTKLYAQSANKDIFVAGNALAIIIGQLQKYPDASAPIFRLLSQICSFCSRQKQIQMFGEQQFQLLWKLTQADKQIKSQIFKWILTQLGSVCHQNAIYELSPILDQSLKVHIFKNYLCNFAKMDYINLSLQEFNIFREFFIEVNRLQNKIDCIKLPTIIRIIRVREGEIVGLKFIWDIFLNCKNEQVLNSLNKFIIILYLYSHPTVTKQVRRTRVLNLMTKIQKNLKDGYRKGNARIIISTIRLLKLLINVVKYRNTAQTQKLTKFSYKYTHKIKVNHEVIEVQATLSSSYNGIYKKLAEKLGTQVSNLVLLNNKKEQIGYEFGNIPFCFNIQKEMQAKILSNESTTLKEVTAFIKNKLECIFIDIIQDSQVSQQAYSVLEQFQFDEKVEELIEKIENTIKAQPKKSETMQLNEIYLRLLQSKIVFSKLQKGFDNNDLLVSLINKNIEILGSQLHLPIMSRLVGFTSRILFSYFKNQAKYQQNQAQKTQFSSDLVVSKCINQIQFVCIITNESDNPTDQQNLQRTKIFFNCFNLIEQLKGSLTLYHLVSQPQFTQIIKRIYLKRCTVELRLICTQKLKKVIKNINQQQETYQGICDHLSSIFFEEYYPKVLQKDVNEAFNKGTFYFYNLASFIIPKLSNNHFQHYIVNSSLVTIIKQKIEEFNDNAKEYLCNYALRGNLDLLAAIYQKKSSLLQKQQIPFFLQNCLELSKNSIPFATPKCYHQQSVKSCFEVLSSGSKDNVDKILQITRHLKEYHLQDHWRNEYSWDVKLDKQAKQKYRGLQNPGCICYMNSFLQQLFMNRCFKNELLNVLTDQQDKEQSQLQLIRQLKKLFLELIYSQEQALDSVPFSKTIKGYDSKPMIKIFVQMDIDEFSNIFFDRFEQSLFKLGHNNFVKSMYGGIYSHQIISTQCVHTSQREEQFMTVSLQVKNSLNESLQALVRPQILDGENKYYCQRCDKKVKAQKIQTIKTSPQYLIIALKRFQYNFQIDAKVKLNDYCEFSQEIDLTKYSQQYIMSQKTKKGQDKGGHNQEEPSQYKYKLNGVVVHSGSAQNGHYYSLIRDHQGKWLEFNDSKVEQFDIKQLADIAFGSKNNEDKVKNAYLLFYEKVSNEKHKPKESLDVVSKIQTKEQNQKIIKNIDKENKVIQIYKLFFSAEYREFIQKTWQVFNKNETNQGQRAQFYQYLINYFLTIGIREQSSKWVAKFATKLKKLLVDSSFSRKMLLQILKSRQMLSQLFVYCFNRKKCKIIQNLLRTAFITQLQNGQFSENHQQLLKAISALTVLYGNINELNKFIRYLISYCKQHNRNDIVTFVIQYKLPSNVLNNIVGTTFSKADKEKVAASSESRLNAYKIQGRVNPEGRKSIGSQLIQSWRFISEVSHYFRTQQVTSQLDILTGIMQKPLVEGSLSRIIHEATSSKTVYYLFQALKNLQSVQQSLFSIQKGLREYQSTKYRPLLLLVQYIACDKAFSEQLGDKLITMIESVIDINQKYFLQVNLVIQWIDRITAFSSIFEKCLLKNEGLMVKILDWIQKHKMSSAELVKKHKNIHNPRNLNKINGIVVSSDPKHYQANSEYLINKFKQMIKDKPIEKISPDWQRQSHHEFKPGNCIRYYYNMENKWKIGLVMSVDFGSIHIKMQDKTQLTQINQQQQILRPQWAYLQEQKLLQESKAKPQTVEQSKPNDIEEYKPNDIEEQDLYN